MGGFSGLAAVVKPVGRTSHDALFPVKRAIGQGKVGHAGTLDRFATGLLLVLAGRYSRLCPWFTALDKRYRARVRFGAETDTLDPEGTVIATAPLPVLDAILSALPSFRGPILQRPPAYSALHVDGRRASERARSGEAVELPPRPVTITELELLEYADGEALIELACSSGTYVRSLARDVALACGSRAHLVGLVRLSIGPLRLEEAVDPDAFRPERDLRPLDEGLARALGFRVRGIDPEAEHAFRNGGKLDSGCLLTRGADAPGAVGNLAAVFNPADAFMGLADDSGSLIRYALVMGTDG